MIDINPLAAFLGGILSLLSPCSVMLLPSFFAYAFQKKTKLVVSTLAFYLGLVTTLMPLGIAAGGLGGFLIANRWVLIAAVSLLLVTFGVLQILGISLGLRRRDGHDTSTNLGVYLLGLGYGVAGGCSGPILGAVLTVSAFSGNAWYGGALLAVYGLGMVIPLFVLALFWDRFRMAERAWLKPKPVRLGPIHTTQLQVITGILMIVLAAILFFTEGTASMPGVLNPDQQIGLEAWLMGLFGELDPTALLLVLGGAVLLALAVLLQRRNAQTSSKDVALRNPHD